MQSPATIPCRLAQARFDRLNLYWSPHFCGDAGDTRNGGGDHYDRGGGGGGGYRSQGGSGGYGGGDRGGDRGEGDGGYERRGPRKPEGFRLTIKGLPEEATWT